MDVHQVRLLIRQMRLIFGPEMSQKLLPLLLSRTLHLGFLEVVQVVPLVILFYLRPMHTAEYT